MTISNKFCNGVCILLLMAGMTPVIAADTKQPVIISDVGFATPESVEYYATKDVYLVTNINGSPFAADGNGFISKLKPDGSVVDLKWIDGSKDGVTLHAPKGAAIAGKHLYVADINQVHVFSLPTGKQLKSITIAGSTFLNGVTHGRGDFVYVTDSGFNEGFAPSGTDAIYKVYANGKYELIVKDKDMGHPNGIWNDKGRLAVVTFGTGKFFYMDKKGQRTELPTPPNGGLDGLLKLKDGRFILSSWGGSAIYALNKNNEFTVLADTLDAPADIGFDSKRQRLLVPLFKQNKVVILPVK